MDHGCRCSFIDLIVVVEYQKTDYISEEVITFLKNQTKNI